MTPLDQILQERLILKTARSAGWQPYTLHGQPGWKYPDRHYKTGVILAHRWKAANKETAPASYLWIPGKPSDPAADFYILPGTLEAIRQANGECWQANGEPALLAFHEAGIHNVIATTHTEAKVPDSTLTVLRDLGVMRLRNPADKDDTGRIGAGKWRDYLAGSGIHYEALALPDTLPEKADFNDLWIFLRGDATAARATLDSLHALELPAPVSVPTSTRHRSNSQGTGRLDRERLLADELAYFIAHGWKRSGDGYYAGRIPWREDKRQSGSYHVASGTFRDLATGEKIKRDELAEVIGLRLDDYRDQPTRRALGYPSALPNNRRPEAPAVQSVTPCKELAPVEPLPDTVIFEIANSFTPGTAMLARLIDTLHISGKLSRRDVFKRIQQAGYPMNLNTFKTAYGWLVELYCQKSHTEKEDDSTYDFFDTSRSTVIARLKEATMTRLIAAAYPESDMSSHLPEYTARMIAHTLPDTADHAAEIASELNRRLPLPERNQARAQEIEKNIQKKYREAVAPFADSSITRFDPADLPDRARSNPNTYLDALRDARLKLLDGQQVSGRAIGATIGIQDPRQRNRKLKARGIIRHTVKVHEEIQDITAIRPAEIRNIAHALRLVAVSRAGDETAAASIDTPRAAEFITTQRAAGYRVYVELQARSRVEISTPPEREPVERQPEIVQFTSVKSVAATREERPDEVPGRYTEHWLRFHILRRLVRDPRGFYANPATGEMIPADLTGTLAELIEALTGYRVIQREEVTA